MTRVTTAATSGEHQPGDNPQMADKKKPSEHKRGSSEGRSPSHDNPEQTTDESNGTNSPQQSGGRSENGLREQLEAAQAERDEHREKWLRAEAELDNFRKRTRKEFEELRKFQALELARDILPALDNLERAVAAGEAAGNVEDLLQGIRMVSQQFRAILGRHAIEPIHAAGEPFDPNLHEAVQQIPTDEHPPMTVLEELELGYKIQDRVIRPSKVVVAVAPPDDNDTGQNTDDDG